MPFASDFVEFKIATRKHEAQIRVIPTPSEIEKIKYLKASTQLLARGFTKMP